MGLRAVVLVTKETGQCFLPVSVGPDPRIGFENLLQG